MTRPDISTVLRAPLELLLALIHLLAALALLALAFAVRVYLRRSGRLR